MKENRRMMKFTYKLNKLMVLILVMLLSTVMLTPASVKASVYYKGTSKPVAIKYRSKKSGSEISIVRHYVDGVQAYCIEAYEYYRSEDKELITLDDYEKFSPNIKRRLELIDYYGKLLGSLTDDQVHVTVQFMIWELTDGVKASDYEFFNGMRDADFERIKTAINQAIDKHSVVVSFDKSSHQLNSQESLQLTDSNQVLSEFVFISSDPSIVSVTQTGNTLTVTAHKPGSVTLKATKVSMDHTGTSLVFFSEDDPTKQDVAAFKVRDELAASVHVTVNEFSKLNIKKVNESGQAVKNTTFNLSKSSSMEPIIGTYVTNEEGIVTVEQLLPGSYYIQEVSVPSPYVLDSTINLVQLSAGKTTTFTQTNQVAKGTIEINKIDPNNHSITGAVFEIRTADGVVVDKVTTNSFGIATSKVLPLKEYVVVETFVPQPYVLDSTPIKASLTYKDQHTKLVSVSLTHSNERAVGQIELRKHNENNEPVVKAKYEIRNEQGNVVDTIETNSQGVGQSIYLPLGDYTVVETFVSNPYLVDSTPIVVKLAYQDQLTKVVVNRISHLNKQPKGQVVITKTDEETGEFLDGVVFELKDSIGKVVETLVTNEEGKIVSSYHPLGHYTLQEVQSSIGYIVDNTVYPVELKYIDMNTPIVVKDLHFSNQPIKGQIQIVKVDANNEEFPIEGAKFGIYKHPEKVLVEEVISDIDGFVYSSLLRYGDYVIQELDAPEQYYLNNHEYPVSIREHGKVYVQYIKNDQVQIRLKVKKVDSESELPLSGAVFEIINSKNEAVTFEYLNDNHELVKESQLITNDKGEAYTKGFLSFGSYTLVEVSAPKGYIKSEPIPFKINRETDSIKLDVIGQTNTITVSNEPTVVTVNKVDVNYEPVSGAHLSLVDENNTVIQEWISDGSPLVLKGLHVDKIYRIIEEKAPSGYLLSKEVEFVVKETTSVQDVFMINELIPTLKTYAEFDTKTKESLPLEQVTIIDTVSYSDVVINKEYRVKGSLINLETQEVIAVSEKQLIPVESTGSISINFEFDASKMLGKKIVVFEELYDGDRLVASHKDSMDKSQTLYIPKISTNAVDEEGLKAVLPINDIKLIDSVIYSALNVNQEYVLISELVRKDNQEVLMTQQTIFTPDSEQGKIEVEVILDASKLENQDVVFFQTILVNNEVPIVIAEHKDINDRNQTISVVKPTLKTTAKFESGLKDSHPLSLLKVIDTVEYSNLVVGKKYTIKGSLIKKDNEEMIARNQIEFVPSSSSGEVEVEFSIDSSNLCGQYLVVFEELYFEDTLITSHQDINDHQQTVRITYPQINTHASIFEQDDDNHQLTVVDMVELKDLISGHEYTLITTIINKETGNSLTDAQENTFIAEDSDFKTSVLVNLDRGLFKPGEYVVVQHLLFNGELIAKHEDLEDKDQTVMIKELIIQKIDSETKEPIKGVEFELIHNENEIDRQVTDSSGRVSFLVIEGHYELRETKAANGYLSNEEVIEIEVDNSIQPIELVIENTRIPEELPSTGDHSLIVQLLGFFFMSGGLIILGKRRKA